MASYNGLVGGITFAAFGNTAQRIIPINSSVPAKFFSFGQFAANVTGVSGTLGVVVIGAVGGATYVIAGRTNISATGGWPVPIVTYVGTSGTFSNTGFPRPSLIVWDGAGAGGSTNFIGITASIFLAGEYN